MNQDRADAFVRPPGRSKSATGGRARVGGPALPEAAVYASSETGLTVAIRESFPEIRIDPAPARGLLIYDGECGFCLRSVRLLERFARRPFDKCPARDLPVALPDEAARTVAEQMLWIEPDGAVWGGSQALLRVLRATGWPALANALGNPVLRPVTRAVYRLVARLRHRLAPGVCELPPEARR